jgi:RNA polymerase sigma-70 factor (ECF subfamily)
MALVLQHYEGLSYDDIAEAMGCSRGTVDGLLSRARATLRDRLREFLQK